MAKLYSRSQFNLPVTFWLSLKRRKIQFGKRHMMNTDISTRMTTNIRICRLRRWFSFRRFSLFGGSMVKTGCFDETAELFDSPDDILLEFLRTFELVLVSSVFFISTVDEESSFALFVLDFLCPPGAFRRLHISFATVALRTTNAEKSGRKMNKNTIV